VDFVPSTALTASLYAGVFIWDQPDLPPHVSYFLCGNTGDLVSIVLGRELSARQDYELLVPPIVTSGLDTTLKPLVDFLTIALVSPNGTTVTPVTVRDKLELELDINPSLVGYRR
jgi:hypothetical protein